jgi:hypothetical protein
VGYRAGARRRLDECYGVWALRGAPELAADFLASLDAWSAWPAAVCFFPPTRSWPDSNAGSANHRLFAADSGAAIQAWTSESLPTSAGRLSGRESQELTAGVLDCLEVSRSCPADSSRMASDCLPMISSSFSGFHPRTGGVSSPLRGVPQNLESEATEAGELVFDECAVIPALDRSVIFCGNDQVKAGESRWC